MAAREVDSFGPLTYGEKVLTATFVLLLLLWTVGDLVFGISATTTAFVGVIVLLIAGVLTWSDITHEHAAWDTMVWFAVLYMMATALSAYGFIGWISELIASGLGDIHWIPALVLLVLIYFFSHYLFASATAHISAMYMHSLASYCARRSPATGSPSAGLHVKPVYFSNPIRWLRVTNTIRPQLHHRRRMVAHSSNRWCGVAEHLDCRGWSLDEPHRIW
ncbi:di-and tricarboxylate transporters [Corynebacterium pilosum]|uniref:Di-and tricarboxylate transporters n=1 Tax=Corynebacterium pilosum TaxID=35756 RepID=A0A376GTM7_9CORY|nr:di-and tricarboxylate transporters [Corynebacterium pilosum]